MWDPPWIRGGVSRVLADAESARGLELSPCHCSLLRFPRRFDDVVVGITTLDADVFKFVPLIDQLNAIARKPVAQHQNGVTVGQSDAKCIRDGRAISSTPERRASAKPASLLSISTPPSSRRAGRAPNPNSVSSKRA